MKIEITVDGAGPFKKGDQITEEQAKAIGQTCERLVQIGAAVKCKTADQLTAEAQAAKKAENKAAADAKAAGKAATT